MEEVEWGDMVIVEGAKEAEKKNKIPKKKEWAISFEQFLANVANEESLLGFFEAPWDMGGKVRQLRESS